MQYHPENTLEKLEFDQIRSQVASYCSGKVSREKALAMAPSDAVAEVCEMLDRAAAMREIRENGLAFPEFRYVEVGKELALLGIGGAVLEGQQMLAIHALVSITNGLIRGVRKQDEFPALQNMVARVQPDETVADMIDAVLDENGRVRSSASRQLADIRKQIDDVRRRCNKQFEGLLRKHRKQGWLREYDESVYHDRRVLAVVAEYKHKIDGIIHGSSESGNTAFVEPAELVGLNNELSGALREEQREVQRILKQLTHDVSKHRKHLQDCFELLADFDLLEAKTRFARNLGAVRPQIDADGQQLFIAGGLHPLLYQKNRLVGLDTVPLEIELLPDERILVISGPNAGGKSIALKTVGLLQVMAQSGLLVPVHESTVLPVFAQILVDIGDDQSIEQQLSTYSSRLKKLKHFLRVADAKSLLLLDEFGTGSDPELGGAIAEAVLYHLLEHRPWGVVTTHFGNIKVAAETLPGLRNGCMLFNEETLEPQYALRMNTPGSSYTFEVARKIGMDPKVLKLAREKVDKRKVKLDAMLVEIQQQVKQLEHERAAIETERHLLLKQLERVAADRADIQEFRASEQKAAFRRLVELGEKYEALIDLWNAGGSKKEVIEKIKQAGARKQRKAQKAAARESDGKPEKGQRRRKSRKRQRPIEVGDRVRLPGGRSAGTVESIAGEKAVVLFGNMKMSVETAQLVLAVKKSSK